MIQFFDPSESDIQRIVDHFKEKGVTIRQDELHFEPKSYRLKESVDEVDVTIRTSNAAIYEFIQIHSADKYGVGEHNGLKDIRVIERPTIYAKGFFDIDELLFVHYELFVTNELFFYQLHLTSPEWMDFRAEIFKQRGFKCELCKSKKNLQLHHLTYKNLGNEQPEDVMILCEVCHSKAHSNN